MTGLGLAWRRSPRAVSIPSPSTTSLQSSARLRAASTGTSRAATHLSKLPWGGGNTGRMRSSKSSSANPTLLCGYGHCSRRASSVARRTAPRSHYSPTRTILPPCKRYGVAKRRRDYITKQLEALGWDPPQAQDRGPTRLRLCRQHADGASGARADNGRGPPSPREAHIRSAGRGPLPSPAEGSVADGRCCLRRGSASEAGRAHDSIRPRGVRSLLQDAPVDSRSKSTHVRTPKRDPPGSTSLGAPRRPPTARHRSRFRRGPRWSARHLDRGPSSQ